MTHLFVADVYNKPFESLPTPTEWWLYNSSMTSQFQNMMSGFIAGITG